MQKGISPLLSGTLFILITVVIATILAGWLNMVSKENVDNIESVTQDRLRCQYSDLFIDSVDYDCNFNCFTGVPYGLNVTLRNSGSVGADFEKINFITDEGIIYTYKTYPDSISPSGERKIGFNDIQITSDPLVPRDTTQLPPFVDENVVALWHFDEAQGTFAYDSALGNTGEISSSILWRGGIFGTSLFFDDDSVLVEDADILDGFPQGMTVEAWINTSTPANNSGIVCKGDEDNLAYCLMIDSNKLKFSVSNAFGTVCEVSATQDITSGWHHVAGTLGSSGIKVYFDGVETSSSCSYFGDLRPTIADLYIGSRQNAAGQLTFDFKGLIDEVRISNISRTFSPVSAITTMDLIINISHSEMNSVNVFDSADSEIFSLNWTLPIDGFNFIVDDVSVGQYRVVVESVDGTIEKWFPSIAGTCLDVSSIERVAVVSTNCPNTAFDSIRGSQLNLINCVG